jgi:hypothetical protein
MHCSRDRESRCKFAHSNFNEVFSEGVLERADRTGRGRLQLLSGVLDYIEPTPSRFVSFKSAARGNPPTRAEACRK